MRYKATIKSILKAGPCYSRNQIRSLFHQLGVRSLTTKMVGDLSIGSEIRLTPSGLGCACSYCMSRRISIDDRIWCLLYAFGLKAKVIENLVIKELLRETKKHWKDIPKSVVQFLKTGEGDTAKIKFDLYRRPLELEASSYRSEVALLLRNRNAFTDTNVAFSILCLCNAGKPKKQVAHLKKLVTLCEAKI